MKLRLYQTDPKALTVGTHNVSNLRLWCLHFIFQVDFVWLGHYKASTLPDASIYEREDSISRPPSDSHLKMPRRKSIASGVLGVGGRKSTSPADASGLLQTRPMNPHLFFECACELIAELTGIGTEQAPA
jgi:hypothetical protein